MPKRRTKDFDLPPRCERRYKSGRISYRPATGGRINFDLPPNATVGQIWDEYERINQTHKPHSLENLFAVFVESEDYKKYSQRTAKDHEHYMTQLEKVFGNSDMSSARPEHILAWRNKKAETAKTQANKQLSFLRIVLQYAISVGLLKSNPAKDVPKLSLTREEKIKKQEDKYAMINVATDEKFIAMYDLLGRHLDDYAPPMLQCYMELQYCIGERVGDGLSLEWSHIDDKEGRILIVQSKTLHRHNKIITPRVSAVLHRARRIQPISKYVIHNQQGKKYSVMGMRANWDRYKERLPKHLWFTSSSIRKMAISDAVDKQLFSQHQTSSMAKHYDYSIPDAPSH
tara:strand:+ start:63 stop:1091 length:1029 start_codon:yes stop_codon:yes gene_type:complete